MITFEPAALPGGGKIIYSWREQDLLFTPSAFLTSNDIFNGGYPYNGGAYIQTIGFPQLLTVTSIDSRPFTVFSVDLAEYSASFAMPVSINFVGTRFDDDVVNVTFTIDGIIDGNGLLADFETFAFPASFSHLRQLTIQSTAEFACSMDNLQVEVVPEPTVISFVPLALALWILSTRVRTPNLQV